MFYSHRSHYTFCARHVLQIHKRVSEELCKGDPGVRVSLQEPQQKVPAALGHPGPGRELIQNTTLLCCTQSTGKYKWKRTAHCCPQALWSHITTFCQKTTFKLSL